MYKALKFFRLNTLLFLLFLFSQGCTFLKCQLDLTNCELIIDRENVVITYVKINHNKEKYLEYKLKEDEKGNNRLNLCYPSQHYEVVGDKVLDKNKRYFLFVEVGEYDQNGKIKPVDQFTILIKEGDWKIEKIIEGTPLRI